MIPCPNCGKPVDPLRAPAVSVRDGKVVGFCSRECKAAAEAQPAKLVPTKIVRAPAGADVPAKGKARTPASGAAIPASSADLDSGPVIEILHEPATGVVTSAADARKTKANPSSLRAETDGAIEIADTGHIDDYVALDEPRRGRTMLIALILVALVGGGVAAAYSLGYFGRDKAAATTPPPAPVKPPVAAPPPDAQVLVEPSAALERAEAVLRQQMKSESPRVQRVAAMALSRTGDPAAIQMLVAALKEETSDLAKLDIAYALARGGDKRGAEALDAAIAGGKRDPRLEAGRRFAALGDKRAIHVLENYLPVTQLRLGIAEQMAFLAEPRAVKVLDGVRADEKAVPDERARATIALGHAGRTDVAPALRELLTDDRQNSFAAQALAGLHDEAARPVLVEQLNIPSLRVKSARGLRRLAPDKDVRELFPPLLHALDSYKDTEQVQVAEALLLLAGPEKWSERE
ncbi:MAG: hypothetical protein HOV81_30180 [Kofleriaceae bacterium]|nr:hypothetical protein [Kofleriaceae bacterium]